MTRHYRVERLLRRALCRCCAAFACARFRIVANTNQQVHQRLRERRSLDTSNIWLSRRHAHQAASLRRYPSLRTTAAASAMIKHSTVASVAVLLLVLAGASQAATLYEINPWIVPPGTAKYPTINATCGDALQFGWSATEGEQGVFKLLNSACPTSFDNSTGQEVAAVAPGPGNITYIVQNEPPFYITSQAGNGANCNQAQILAINATCPPEALANLSTINAAAPPGAASPGAYGGAATPGAYGAAGTHGGAAPSGAGGYGTAAAPGGYGGH